MVKEVNLRDSGNKLEGPRVHSYTCVCGCRGWGFDISGTSVAHTEQIEL